MLDDPMFLDEVEKLIRHEAVNAEWALEQVTHRLAAQFEQLGDLYLRERRTDLLDVALELQRTLQGRITPAIEEDPGADDPARGRHPALPGDQARGPGRERRSRRRPAGRPRTPRSSPSRLESRPWSGWPASCGKPRTRAS